MATVTESDVIKDVYLVDPDVHGDDRGIFVETYRRQWFPHGREMIQGNRADRQAGAIVGLHYHLHQADYWYIPFGTARVVCTICGKVHPPTGPRSPSIWAGRPTVRTRTVACSSRLASRTASAR